MFKSSEKKITTVGGTVKIIAVSETRAFYFYLYEIALTYL